MELEWFHCIKCDRLNLFTYGSCIEISICFLHRNHMQRMSRHTLVLVKNDTTNYKITWYHQHTSLLNFENNLPYYLCNGSIWPCTYTEEYYIQIDGQTVYLRYHMDQTPWLANPPVQRTPPGTCFLDPLHVILTGHGPYLCYVYVYSTATPSTSRFTRTLRRCIKIPIIFVSDIRGLIHLRHWKFRTGCCFRLDSTHFFYWILLCFIQLNLTHV